MSRYIPNHQPEAVFNVAEKWKERCLLTGGSLFFDRNLWAPDTIKELIEHYVKKPDAGENSFWNKLEIQLNPASENAKLLAAELLYILYLPFQTIEAKTRLDDINKILAWTAVGIIETTHAFFKDEIHAGAGGKLSTIHRWRELDYSIRFIDALLASTEKRELLSDSEKLADWMEAIDGNDKRQFRHILLYILFPDKFERVFSNQHRQLIIKQFRKEKKIPAGNLSALETDRLLSEIREEMEKKYATEEIDFYYPPLSERWLPDKSPKDSKSSAQNISTETTKSSAPTKTNIGKSVNSTNCIYYGPPGTGKTWNTVNHALAIIEAKSVEDLNKEKREETKKRFDELKRTGRIEMVTFHQNYTYEDFIEGIRPVLSSSNKNTEKGQPEEKNDLKYELSPGVFKKIVERARNDEEQNYVLIIDEINRGNIAKIFGELITLIEPSKRLGKEDETTVTLPYSKKTFGVPNNLHIIGAMNTADRSIALLDTALRRRFDFVEMMPDPKHSGISKDIQGVNCQELLEKINERIRILHDRDHQIGHTYFLDVKNLDSLAKTFQNQIIPLLQEYFYDNWDKIDLVLNKNGFIQESGINKGLFKTSEYVDAERKIYKLLSANDIRWKAPGSYISIYNTQNQSSQERQENQNA